MLSRIPIGTTPVIAGTTVNKGEDVKNEYVFKTPPDIAIGDQLAIYVRGNVGEKVFLEITKIEQNTLLNLDSILLEQGSIWNTGENKGENTNSKTRLRTKDFLNGHFSIYLSEEFIVKYVYYYKSDTLSLYTNTSINDRYASIGIEGCVCRVVFSYKDESEISVEDIKTTTVIETFNDNIIGLRNAVISDKLNVNLIGNNDEPVTNTFTNVTSGKYKIWIPNPNVDMTGVSLGTQYSRFIIRLDDADGNTIKLIEKYIGEDIRDVYDIEIPDDGKAYSIYIFFRASKDALFPINIERITETIDEKADVESVQYGYSRNYNNYNLWEQGHFTGDGLEGASNAAYYKLRIRTKGYLDHSISALFVKSGFKVFVFKFSKDGLFVDSKSYRGLVKNIFDYNNYEYRLALGLESDASITTEDYSSIIMLAYPIESKKGSIY